LRGAGGNHGICGAEENGEDAVSFSLGLTTVPPFASTADVSRESWRAMTLFIS
jgi:hypothetical protein